MKKDIKLKLPRNAVRDFMKRHKPQPCAGCDSNVADPPSRYCPGCEAYKDHQR